MIKESILKDVCSKYGYDKTEYTFEQTADVKIRWQRSYKWIKFYITDYFSDMPDDVFKAFIEYVMRKMNEYDDKGYPKAVSDYLLSDDFFKNKRDLYINRHEGKIVEVLDDDILVVKPNRNVPPRDNKVSYLFKVIILGRDNHKPMSLCIDEINSGRANIRYEWNEKR